MRMTTLLIAFGLLVAALSVAALACDDDELSEEEATAQLCEDLDALEAADAAFDDLGGDSTIDEIRATNDAYNEALDDAVGSARDVANVRTQPIEDAYDNLAQAVNDIPGDATITEALVSIADELGAVDAAWDQAFAEIDCP